MLTKEKTMQTIFTCDLYGKCPVAGDQGGGVNGTNKDTMGVP